MLQADHDQVGQDLYDAKQRLLDQLDANHVLTELKYTGNTGVKMMDQAIFMKNQLKQMMKLKSIYKMGLIARKPVFMVSDKVRFKPACSVIETR